MASTSGWNWSTIPFELPLSCKKDLQAAPFAMAASSQDKLVWIGAKHGEFDLKSVFLCLGPS